MPSKRSEVCWCGPGMRSHTEDVNSWQLYAYPKVGKRESQIGFRQVRNQMAPPSCHLAYIYYTHEIPDRGQKRYEGCSSRPVLAARRRPTEQKCSGKSEQRSTSTPCCLSEISARGQQQSQVQEDDHHQARTTRVAIDCPFIARSRLLGLVRN